MAKFLLVKVLFLPVLANCQIDESNPKDKVPYYFSASYNYGYIIKHRKSVEGIGNVYPKGIEMHIGYQTTGNKYWHSALNYPRVGLQVLLYDLGRPEMFGYSMHITPNMDFFLINAKRHQLSLKIGTGLGFYTKYYDKVKNPENVFVSQVFCMTGLFNLSYYYNFSKNFSLFTGIGFNHGSNGSLRQPNLGINIPSIHAGAFYLMNQRYLQKKKPPLPEYSKKLQVNASISFSSRQTNSEPLNDVNYFASTQSIALVKRVSRGFAFLAGFDACYDGSIKYTLRENQDYLDHKYPIWRFAIPFGIEVIAHEKLRVTLQNAFYLYDPYKLDKPYYQRYGLKYGLSKRFYLGYYLKTHLAKADFWEFAFGVKI